MLPVLWNGRDLFVDTVGEMNAEINDQRKTTALLAEIKRLLELRKAEIYNEISDYPPPIPACDAQFNYLLELRNVVNQELSQINALMGEQAIMDNPSERIDTFVQSSIVLRKKTKKEIQQLTFQKGKDS